MRAFAPPAKSTKPPKRASPARIPPNPAIGRIDDPSEQHADTVADQVMRMASPPATNATDAASVGSEDASSEHVVRRSQTAPAASPGAADPAIGFADVALAAPGRPLDASTRSYFEPRFGADLSHVRVHSDDAAKRSAASIGARAYTHGADVFYAAGERPGPDRLTAHELAHVVQNAAAAEPSVIRRTPAGGAAPYEIISPIWNVAGRDIVVVRMTGDGRVFLFYRRTGLGPKGVGFAPPPGTWAPFDGLVTVEKLKGGVPLETEYFEKNAYYRKPDRPELRGYGTQTNKDTAMWLNRQDIPKGQAADWQVVQAELAKNKPLAPSSPPARAVSGEIPKPGKPGPVEPVPSGPGPASSGATKAEGTVGKLESKIGELEGSAVKKLGRGAKAARFGAFLLEMALPGPWDVLDLWISFFGSIAEAKEKLRSQDMSVYPFHVFRSVDTWRYAGGRASGRSWRSFESAGHLRPKTVTHVSRINRHPCVRNGPP